MNIEKLARRLKRLTAAKNKLEGKHVGNEQKFTYHGGFSLGYLKGQISVLEGIVDPDCDDE